ncbi:hypothetical protein V8F20_012310 [Naviculisporaceae sp. PSN 640]
MPLSYSQALRNGLPAEEREPVVKTTPKPKKRVRFDLETETSVTDDGVIVGEFTKTQTYPKSSLSPPAKFPTFGAEIKTIPPCNREFPVARPRPAPQPAAKSWREKYSRSRGSSSAVRDDEPIESSFDVFRTKKLQRSLNTVAEEQEERKPGKSATEVGGSSGLYFDPFAVRIIDYGSVKDTKNSERRSSHDAYNRMGLGRTSSSSVIRFEFKQGEFASRDDGNNDEGSTSNGRVYPKSGTSSADVTKRSCPPADYGQWWW